MVLESSVENGWCPVEATKHHRLGVTCLCEQGIALAGMVVISNATLRLC